MTTDLTLILYCSARCLEQLTTQQLAELSSPVQAPGRSEHLTLSIGFVTEREQLLPVVRRLAHSEQAPIMVSDRFAVAADAGSRRDRTTTAIKRMLWRSGTPSALIALVADGAASMQSSKPAEVDDVLDWPEPGAPLEEALSELRARIVHAAHRLWWLRPAAADRRMQGDHHEDRLELAPIRSELELAGCLSLRRRIYADLGYAPELKGPAQLHIELDGYDPSSIHLAVRTPAPDSNVVASARIILPGGAAGLHRDGDDAGYCDPECLRAWCLKLAKGDPSKAWWRKLDNPRFEALPVLEAFRITTSNRRALSALVDTSQACEISRVVVDPRFRGLGLGARLVNHALRVARRCRKEYVLLECAPNHVEFYRKLGFALLRDNGTGYYQIRSAPHLDTMAVAMLRTEPVNLKAVFRERVPGGPARGAELELETQAQCAARARSALRAADAVPDAAARELRGGGASLANLLLASLVAASADEFLGLARELLDWRCDFRISVCAASGDVIAFTKDELASGPSHSVTHALYKLLGADHG